ncbi:MAG: 3-hydroxyacyl-CoA dehydrogenase family protein [Candidatus Omnitrophica bacterium]|nr:3-hydroxyacyl-CoA dehydrogenase family protein [Candidatus Omnitrophota bacterium]
MEGQQITTVCIVGAGVMGEQISLSCAVHGYSCWLVDSSSDALQNARSHQEAVLMAQDRSVKEKDAVLRRIHPTLRLAEGAAQADFVIETIPENLDLKRSLFRQLDELCSPRAVLASNSSSLRISKIEDAVKRKDRVLNMHFFGSGAAIVELMRGSCTSDETIAFACSLARSLELIPIVLKKESTGFLYNRIWRAIKKEALKIVDEGAATPEDVDRACMHMWSMFEKFLAGPFGYMDYVGLDTVLDIEMVYYDESRDESDLPPKFLLEKIEKGELGVKTGRGFYTYPNPKFLDPKWLKGEAE